MLGVSVAGMLKANCYWFRISLWINRGDEKRGPSGDPLPPGCWMLLQNLHPPRVQSQIFQYHNQISVKGGKEGDCLHQSLKWPGLMSFWCARHLFTATIIRHMERKHQELNSRIPVKLKGGARQPFKNALHCVKEHKLNFARHCIERI